jgi:hypothetical protein
VESKLLSFGRVQGIVFGNYGEVSEATHKLLDTITTSRVRVALPQSAAAKRGQQVRGGRKGFGSDLHKEESVRSSC